jgi:serine/threonine protein kinase/tetratricopeptide (TPR) repeat protein
MRRRCEPFIAMPRSALPPPLPLELQYQLDAVCNAYESAWHRGGTPSLEDALQSAPESVRAAALPELIQIEVHYRRQAGAALDALELHSRFPDMDPTWLFDVVSSTAAPAAYPEIAGFQIIRLLGRGGMGVVYHARDVKLDRPVALKLVHPGKAVSPEERMRFRFEAELAARVRHPNVVQVYEVGEHDGQPYVALEYVAGGTLAEHIRSNRPTPTAAAELLATLAEAVGAAHAQGIIHRDLKPANILLQIEDCELPIGSEAGTLVQSAICNPHSAIPKITDFGLARRLDQSARLTATGVIVGTPAYMAPEQARADKYLGPAVDIYALGAILYELLTGQPPFSGATAVELLARIVSEDPLPPSHLAAATPRDLEVICLKCLARDPQRRYASAADLAADLHAFLEDRPITARPARWPERLARWCRRHPAVAGVSATLAVVIPAALVGLTLLYLDADRERQRATRSEGRAQDGYRLARQAWQDGVKTVLDDPRFKSGPFEDLRQQVLRAETKFYEPFVELYKDEDAYQSERGKALHRLAEATNELGSKEDALGHYRAALAIFQSLADQDRRDAEHRYLTASVHNDLGNWYVVSSLPADAEKEYRAAGALFRDLADEHPDKLEYRSSLANSHNGLGAVCRTTRRVGDAEKAWGTARDLWQELLTKEQDNRTWRSRLATAQGNLGLLYLETHRPKDAETALRASRSAGEELVAKEPDNAEYQLILVRADNNLGALYQALNRPDDAEKAYQSALKVMKVVVEQRPAVTKHQEDLAKLYNTLANLYLNTGRWQQALGPCRDNVARCEALVAKHAGIPEYQRQLALARMQVANVHHFAGRFTEAERAYRESLPDWEAVAKKRPDDPECCTGLACVLYNLGRLAQGRGDNAAALAWFDNAVRPLQALTAELRKHAEVRLHQRNAHWGRADVLAQLHRAAEALPEIDRAVELTDGADRPLILVARGLVLAKAKRCTDAVAAVEPLVEPPGAAGGVLYRAACVHALASAAETGEKAETHAQRAVELLMRAQRTGLFRDAAIVAALSFDEDLAFVRTRADFKKLLGEARAGLKRGAP